MADSAGLRPSAPEERSSKWYDTDPPNLRPETKEVLEKYSKIPPDQIESHVRTIRDKAWAIHRYPCIGQWRFLDLFIGFHNLYPEILDRMRTGEQAYLDLGCAFAGDIRLLVSNGVDSANCYGSDFQSSFIELGYDLFRDKDTLKSEFIVADIFDANSSLNKLEGRVDIIGASSFFHLFSWDDQKKIALRTARLLKPRKDSLIVGRQVGDEVAGDKPRFASDGSRWRHNHDSWRRLWQEVGDEIGVQFEVEATSQPAPGDFQAAGAIWMQFSIRRQ